MPQKKAMDRLVTNSRIEFPISGCNKSNKSKVEHSKIAVNHFLELRNCERTTGKDIFKNSDGWYEKPFMKIHLLTPLYGRPNKTK